MRTALFPAPLLVLALTALATAFGCSPAPNQIPVQAQPTPKVATGETTSPESAPTPGPTLEPTLEVASSDTHASGAAPTGHTQTLEVDPAQSSVGFAVARATTGHIGHFERFSAHLELVDEVPTSMVITVQTGSVVADRSGLTSHLMSADFFDVHKFPSAIFTTERITPQPQIAPNVFELSGTMRLHGVGRKITFEAMIDVEPDRVVGRAPLDISANAFGIQYEGMEAELAEDAVQLEIELIFPRPKV